MKKKLILFSLSCLFISCSNEKVGTITKIEKATMSIVNPQDPDMNNYPTFGPSASSRYTDPNLYYGKDYLLINETTDTIRVNMYALPKFTTVSNQIINRYQLNLPDYLLLDFIYLPQTEVHATLMVNYPMQNYPGVHELWDHMYTGIGLSSPGGIINVTLPYFHKYPTIGSFESALYKVAFIEFWIQNGTYEGDHHWLAVESFNSFQDIIFKPQGQPNFSNQALPFGFPLTGVQFFGLNNELPEPIGKPQFNVYYYHPQITNNAKDTKFNIEGTFRYMPHSVTPNFPHFNPDNSPGYILKFENL